VDIGGRALSLYCAGRGEPTVILDHGLHGSADDWGDALLRISADETSGQHTFTRVCSYDRAGRGESDRVAGIRTAEDFAADLDRLLKAARIARPVVLVGNGFASYHLRVFAARHPDDVAGMVFVDGYHPDMPRRFLRLLPADASKDGPFVRKLRKDFAAESRPGHADRPERYDRATGASQARRVRTLGDVPLMVLAAGARIAANWSHGELSDAQEAKAQPLWESAQRELASLSKNSAYVLVPDAGPFIWQSHPDLVWDGIQAVVLVARDGGRVADHAPQP
jgi:pimeloyl-ACP methyl ester carboxylesterase